MCNLITREYTELRCPVDYIPPLVFQLGFGVSKIRWSVSMRTPTFTMYTPSEQEHGGALQPALLLVSDSIQLHTLFVMATSIGQEHIIRLMPYGFVVLI